MWISLKCNQYMFFLYNFLYNCRYIISLSQENMSDNKD